MDRNSIPKLGSRTRSVDYEKMEMMNRNIRRSRDPSISNLTNRLVNSIDSFQFKETNCETLEMSLALMSQNYIEVCIGNPTTRRIINFGGTFLERPRIILAMHFCQEKDNS